MAEALSITQRTLSFNEREAGDIPAGLAPPMARALGVSVDELLGEYYGGGVRLSGRWLSVRVREPRSRETRSRCAMEGG